MKLADVISKIESNGNQWAQRLERLHLGASQHSGLLARIAAANKCSLATADVYAAMSHGMFQVMGFRLYGDALKSPKNLDYRGSVGLFLSDVELQRDLFDKYTRQLGIAFSVDELLTDPVKRAKFAAEYNGPDNVDVYSTRILTAIRSK